MNIQQLAAEMGVQESTLQSFVNCLRVWTDKGYSLEDAIKKHMDIMNRMKANSQATVAMFKEDCAKPFYPEESK